MKLSAMNALRYDANTYEFDLRQSVGPGEYVLGTPVPHCSPCFANDPRNNNGTSGGAVCNDRSLIDVDSDLQGITRRATSSPSGKYLPTAPCQLTSPPNCVPQNVPIEDTRLNNPPCTLRGTGWNRWEWLCTDPQERALVPFDLMIDTSIVVKDNHRPVLPRPIDQTAAMPPGKHNAPSHGAPQWQPRCEPEYVSPIPNVHWRTCGELDRIQNGCATRG